MWKSEITLFSYLCHITFILFSHFGARDPGLGPKAAARGPGRAWPAAALGPGPGFRAPYCENNMKIVFQNVKIMWFHTSTLFSHFCILFSHLYHICGLGTQIRAPKVICLSYSWSYSFHIIFIFLWKPSFPACPYGQSLQLNAEGIWGWGAVPSSHLL